MRPAQTIEKGHGRIETRRLDVTATLAKHLAPSRPGLAQVCRITRERIVRGKASRETVYAITSPTADQAGAAQVLAALRNTALTVVRRLGFKPVEGFDHFAEHRQHAINALIGQRTE